MLSIKKRGKSNSKLSISDAIPIHSETVLSPEKLPSNLILHLKKIKGIVSEDSYSAEDILKYKPEIPIPNPYDPIGPEGFSYVEGSKIENDEKDYKELSNHKNTHNNIKLCWWCCHDYSSRSLGLPISKNDDNSFECIGNFCSPECTCAYIMDSGSRYGERWKEYELLHEMIQVNEKIEPAPRRELLKVFGGDLDITEFRSNTNWKIVYPPMVSLKMQMDDTPTEKEGSPLFLSSNTLKIGNLNLEHIDEIIPEKRKKNKKSINVNGSLDRFWSTE
tara:strand:+ start:1471 stop:2298 length:828 start_codon:yes stop_codon:yes gene_type:complete